MAVPNQQRDSTMDHLLVVALVVAVPVGLWFLWRDSIIFLGFGFSLAVIAPFALVAEMLALTGVDLVVLQQVMAAWNVLTGTPWHQLDRHFAAIMAISGRCLVVLMIPAMLLAHFGSRKLRPDRTYRERHDIESCIRALGRHWSCARWLAWVNPARAEETAVPVDHVAATREDYMEWLRQFHHSQETSRGKTLPQSGSWLMPSIRPAYRPPPFGRALRPEEWLAAHGQDWNENEDLIIKVDMLLGRQLKSRWRGWPHLPSHARALLAVLLLIEGGDSKGAEALLDDLMIMMASGHDDFDFASRFKDHEVGHRVHHILASSGEDIVPGIARGHWWEETVLAEAWVCCRDGKGVWPSARLQWLKTVDRTLWYAISSMGSNAVYVECAGILAHHLAEKQLQMPLAVPRVRQASEAIVYDYLDLDPERVKTRKARQRVQEQLVPGQVLELG